MKIADIVRITDSCSAILIGTDDMVDVPKNSLAKIISLYTDEGYWSDEDPTKYQSPFPAARLFLLDQQRIIDSVHVKLLTLSLE
jgi:hypothetical protein